MKRLIAIYLMSALCTTAARAVERIEIFADEAGTTCHMEDNTDGFRTVYVFLNGTAGATAAVFRAPKPECWTGATWISDHFNGGKFGDSQRGMELTFGGCRQGSIYLGSIVYSTTGDASECCVHGVYPNPFGTWSTVQAHYADCAFTAHPVQTANLVINSTPACSDCLAPPPPPPPIEPPPPPPPPPPPAGEYAIDLYMDTAMQSCELYEASGVLPRVVDIHMFHTGTTGAVASQFAAPKPACWTGASYIGETFQPQFLTLGNTQTDISIAYTNCLTPPIYLGRITYLIVTASTPACCVYQAQAAPQYQTPVASSCEHRLFYGVAGPGVIINPDGSCSCAKAVPVREATWGRIKAMYSN